jgi:ABC-type branched-subunit amino acid transport system substrate-binding protein
VTTARAGRRTFLSRIAVAGGVMLWPRVAGADEVHTVGLVLPATPAEATALERGAALGLDDANALATMFGKRLRLETRTAADGAAAAQAGRALASARALAVVGGAGAGVADALRDAAAGAAVFMNVASAADVLRNERCERRAFHLVPSVTMHVDALVQWAVERRKVSRWAITGDGSPRGREIEAAARRALARAGAAIGSAAAAEMVLLAVDEIAVPAAVARARAEGRAGAVAGIGGDVALRLGPEEAAGLWSTGWFHELDRFSARELNGRFRRRFAAPFTETAWAAWAALKLIGEGVVRGGATDGGGLVTFLESAPPFDGHKGAPLTFRTWDRQLRQPLYVIGPRKREEIGGTRGPFAVLAYVGSADLDAIGTSQAETRCRSAP